MCLKSLFIDHVRTTLFTLLSRTMNRFFQPAITAVQLSAALVVIAVALLRGSVAQGAATYIKRDGTIVDSIMDIHGSPHPYSGNNLEPSAWLPGANLTGADLDSAYLYNAYLDSATFSLGTTLYDGQTVLQHGFDTAGLQAYLEAYPVNASAAANIILVPESHTLLLASLASMGLTLRRRRSAR